MSRHSLGWGLPASIQRGSYGAFEGKYSISLSTGSVVEITGGGENLFCKEKNAVSDLKCSVMYQHNLNFHTFHPTFGI